MSNVVSGGLRERTYGAQRLELSGRIRGLLGTYWHSWEDKTIADIGCGRGYWLEYFRGWGVPEKQLFGIDLDVSRLSRARQTLVDSRLSCGDAKLLPFPDSVFDAVSQFTLFSSLKDPRVRSRVAGELLRVLKPGGLVIWHDFFIPNPLNRATRRVSRHEIRALFRNCEIEMIKVTLLAPLARALCRVSESLIGAFERIPLLRTHYLAIIRKPAAPNFA